MAEKLKLTASLGEISLFSGLAATRSRLHMAGAFFLCAGPLYGLAARAFIDSISTSTALNVAVLCGQFAFLIVGAWVGAMMIGMHLFGDSWRVRYLAPQPELAPVGDAEPAPAPPAPASEEDDLNAIRDRSLPFFSLVAALGVASYAAVVSLTDDYIDTYGFRGYYLTQLRAPEVETRILALQGMGLRLNRRAGEHPDVREAVAARVSEGSGEEVEWAAFAAGHLGVAEASEPLIRVLRDGTSEQRAEAAQALGRLRDREAELLMIGMLPASIGDATLATGLARGLALARSSDAAPALAQLLGRVPADVEPWVLWAIGESGTTEAADAVLARLRTATDLPTRCAVAETLKRVSTVSIETALREAFFEVPDGTVCERLLWTDRPVPFDPGLPVTVVVRGEELRIKILKAVFNVAGTGLFDWLVLIANDPSIAENIRFEADDLATAVRRGGQRVPRE